MPMTGGLLESIVEKLSQADVVLADITDRNANVFYELGVRHALRRGTIIVSQGGDPPSDLRGLWFLRYGVRPGEVRYFKSEIKRLLNEINNNPEKADSPVSVYLEKENRMVASFVRHDNVKKLGALYTELTGNLNLLRAATLNRKPVGISLDCLDLLCATYYCDMGPSLLAQIYELREALRRISRGNLSPEMLRETEKSIASAATAIFDLRERLVRGDYQEPTIPSLMVWNSGQTPPAVTQLSDPSVGPASTSDQFRRGEEPARSVGRILCRSKLDCGCGRCSTWAEITEYGCGCIEVDIFDDRGPCDECTDFTGKRRYCGESGHPESHGD